MNGPMMNYKRYQESLKKTPEPNVKKFFAIDYQGLISYAKEKGKYPCDLSENEKKRFILK